MSTRLGLTLPSFVRDPEVPIRVARAAEEAGLDAAFCYDHLFRHGADGRRRPAIEGTTLLGAIAAETTAIGVGTLVARATLRPPAQLAVAFDTVQRISRGRLIAAIGAGDSQSVDEMVTFGYDFGTPATRSAALEAAVASARGRGFPVWVGGHLRALREFAARAADGWNAWGSDVEHFATQVSEIRAAAPAGFTCSWGGLVLVGADDDEVAAKRDRFNPAPAVVTGTPKQVAAALSPYVDAGAEWMIVGPLDASDPANAALLADVRARL